MISDLLPLYKDDICSEASKKIVSEHLAECPACSDLLNKMNDISIDEEIINEKNEVISSQAKFFKRKSALAGLIVAAVFALPVLICFIADILGGGNFGWFFIVFAAMLIPAALIVVPLMAPKNKMFLTMSAFAISIILLLGVCCIYNRGNWFFIAASAVLFGLTMIFSPFICLRRPVKYYLKNSKGLAIMAADTITFTLMMLCIGLTIKSAGFFGTAFVVASPIIVLAWLIFIVIRYIPVNGFIKAGIIVAIFIIFKFAVETWVNNILLKLEDGAVHVSTSIWPGYMVIGLVIAAILIIIGVITKLIGGKKNDIN